LLYIIIFGAVTSLRHYNFQTQTWDMGIFTQIMWNITKGNGAVGTLEFVHNHFAVHMSPILFLLAPGYMAFQSPYFLLIVQTLALALGAWPLFLLARKVLNLGSPNSLGSRTSQKLALTIAIAYLLYPSLNWVNWFDFHPIAFLAPAFLAAFYFAEAGQWRWMSLFLILAASAQEDAVLVVAFFGIYLMIKDAGRPQDVRRRYVGITIFILSTAYFLLATKLIMPYFGGGLLRLDRYAHLGGSFLEIAKNLFIHPSLFISTVFQWQKLVYLFWLFLPVVFLPILAPRELILLIPGLAQNLFTNYAPQFAGAYQYDSALIAGIFIAVVYGLEKAISIFAFLAPPSERGSGWRSGPPPTFAFGEVGDRARAARQTRKNANRLPILILIVAPLLALLIRSPISPFNFPIELFKTNPRAETFRKILNIVPQNASVAAHTNLVPHIAHREKIFMLGLEPTEPADLPDIVIMDGADYFGFGTPEMFEQYAQKYASSDKYNATIVDDRYYILTRKK